MEASHDPSHSEHPESKRHLSRGLGLFDSTNIVAGSMIGSGIFIVAGEMSREVGSSGWMMVSWLIATVLTMTAALSYGELAAMFPRAGGQYVYLREAFSPLWGFLYGWTLFLVIQTGTIAAASVGFARYLGVLWPAVSESKYIIQPIHVLPGYALSLSTAQLCALCIIVFLAWTNAQGLKYGKGVQNVFTTMKIGSLLAVIVIGCFYGWNSQVVHSNWDHPFHAVSFSDGLTPLTAFAIFIALCTSQIGSLFAADAWNNITFSAGEVRNPAKNVPLSLALGTLIVMGLYMGANFAYTVVLSFHDIQTAPSDRVGAMVFKAMFPHVGQALIAIAIMISAFGCVNGLTLAGPRAYYAMALDGVFFKKAAALNKNNVPSAALVMQALWASILVMARTFNSTTGKYGNLYSDLLDYIISAALIFYILTITGLIRLRKKMPNAERPYKAFGYPFVPIFYILAASVILVVLFIYRTSTTIPGVVIVLIGVPVYLAFRASNRKNTEIEKTAV